MSSLINAGIPLISCFDIISETTKNEAVKKLSLDIKQNLKNGLGLAESFMSFPRYFSPFYCSLLEIAEETGSLEKIMGDISDHKNQSEKVKKSIKKAITYPAFVIALSLALVIGMLTVIIPKFSEIFLESGNDLPALTMSLVNLSEFISDHLILIALFIVGFFYFIRRLLIRNPDIKYKIIFAIPVINETVKLSILSNLARNIYICLNSGVHLTEALNLTQKTTDCSYYATPLRKTIIKIQEGETTSSNLKRFEAFPPLFTQMMEIGEESGRIDVAMQKVASAYEEDMNERIEKLLKLMEPTIMLVVGILVAILLAALYQPIFQLGGKI
jgi:type IV pilus assembly protein PilC